MATHRNLSGLSHDCTGATAIEYGLILAVIVLIMLIAFEQLAGETVGLWNSIATKSAAAISNK